MEIPKELVNTVIKTNYFWDVADNERLQKAIDEVLQSLLFGQYGFFASDNLIAWSRSLSFIWDENFVRAFVSVARDPVQAGIIWRRAVHYWAARHCLRLDGDFVECGTHKGDAVRLIINATDFGKSGKEYWLYDVFNYKEGDEHHYIEGLEDGLFEKVKASFSQETYVRIIQGYVPDSFSQGMPDKIALLHLDMNSVTAEVGALEALWDRMTTGGILLLDDFGWLRYSKQTRAHFDFFKERGYPILDIPTGQGLVIR